MRILSIGLLTIFLLASFLGETQKKGDFLEPFAEEKMKDLISTGHFEHTNSNGCNFSCRVVGYREEYSWLGENLYRGVCSLDNAHRLWELSPPHKRVLEHRYTYEVVLIEEYEPGRCYIILLRALAPN